MASMYDLFEGIGKASKDRELVKSYRDRLPSKALPVFDEIVREMEQRDEAHEAAVDLIDGDDREAYQFADSSMRKKQKRVNELIEELKKIADEG